MLFQQLVNLFNRSVALLTSNHSLDLFQIRDDISATEFDFLATSARAFSVQVRHSIRLKLAIGLIAWNGSIEPSISTLI